MRERAGRLKLFPPYPVEASSQEKALRQPKKLDPMPEAIATYQTRVHGFWNTRHVITGPEGEMGVLSIERNAKAMIVRGRFAPKKGEVLLVRRDPGILRSQFSLWTEGREWLGSSLRWSFVRRDIALATGNKPYRLLPVPGFRRGWRMVAPKTGEMARLTPSFLARSSRIEVFRRVDFELVVFAYFLGCQVYAESLWPGRDIAVEQETVPTPSKA